MKKHDASIQKFLPLLARGLAGRYEILSVLGQGGNGMVLEVHNLALDRPEALKFLLTPRDLDAATRFEREAKLAASLEHPAIVPIYAFGETAGRCWFTMKLVEGPSLWYLLRAEQRLEESLAIRMLLPILDALDLAHRRGVVHRDIKPENILMDSGGHPLLADFGIAKEENRSNLTMSGMVLGTPAYLSPEQVQGIRLDGRTDIYALGVTLYQVLSGELPFSGGSSLQTLMKRLKEDPPEPRTLRPDLSLEMNTIILTAIARDREGRFPDAPTMSKALRAAASRLGIDLGVPIEIRPEWHLQRRPLGVDLGPVSREPQLGDNVFGPVGSEAATTAMARPQTRSDDATALKRVEAEPTVATGAGSVGVLRAPTSPPPLPRTESIPTPKTYAEPRSSGRLLRWLLPLTLVGAGAIGWVIFKAIQDRGSKGVPLRQQGPAASVEVKNLPVPDLALPKQEPSQPPPASPPRLETKPEVIARRAEPKTPPSSEKNPAKAEPPMYRPMYPGSLEQQSPVEGVDGACTNKWVPITVTVAVDGTAKSAVLTPGGGKGVCAKCREAARQAALKSKYKPARSFEKASMESDVTISIQIPEFKP